MTEEAKHFVMGLELSRKDGGMIWYGKLPPEVAELYQLPQDFRLGDIAGVYVEIKPQYTPFEPEWLKEDKDG